MAQSSNYKQYNRQTRMLTEETAFSGGMMWTGNNINSTHLKTIVNFNYDDTTGFLKTRNPFSIPDLNDYSIPSAEKYAEYVMDSYGTVSEDPISVIPGLSSKQLIGAYNMCYTESVGTPDGGKLNMLVYEHNQSNAGWLYLFGDVTTDAKGFSTCPEESLVWVFYDGDANWHTFEPYWWDSDLGIEVTSSTVEGTEGSSETKLYDIRPYTGTLTGASGIKPILYDNVLYCTCADDSQAFYAYRLFKRTVKRDDWDANRPPSNKMINAPGFVGGNTSVGRTTLIDKYYVCKQVYEYDEADIADGVWQRNLFDATAKTLADSTTLLEASVTGFNGLRGTEMFTYNSTYDTEGTGTKRILGAYFKDGDEICVAPRLGQSVKLHVILDNVPTENKGILKLLRLAQGTVSDVDALWETVDTCEVTGSDVFRCIASEETGTYNIVWCSDDSENSTRYDGLIYNYSTNKLNTQLHLKGYNIPTAKGSCLWNSHLVLWDVNGASNCLFISETDNFYYMPVPNNVAAFETNIISCIPYMGSLLVFTSDRVYRLIEDNEGAFVQEVVQNNMPLSRGDAPYIRAVKNMIFFKSGNYYYMIVPKAQSLTGELSVAPIYKNLAGWFDNPSTATKEILTHLYPENFYATTDTEQDAVTVSLPKEIYVEQDTVSILYEVTARYSTAKKVEDNLKDCREYRATEELIQKLMLFVNYNTNLRAWTMYVEDTTKTCLYPAALTAARTMSFVRVTDDDKMYISTMRESTDLNNGIRCLIDTGYRTLSGSLKKRFREVQVKLYSATEDITSFGSAFFVDGSVRRSYSKLEEVFVTGDTNFVSLAPVYDPNTFLLESAVTIDATGNPVFLDAALEKYKQGSDGINLSDWVLDFSHFKRGAPATIRVPVSGKGYAPRFIFMSPKCIAMHLNEINWVYRIMNGR